MNLIKQYQDNIKRTEHIIQELIESSKKYILDHFKLKDTVFDFMDVHATVYIKQTTINSIEEFVNSFNSLHRNTDIIINKDKYQYIYRLSILRYSKSADDNFYEIIIRTNFLSANFTF